MRCDAINHSGARPFPEQPMYFNAIEWNVMPYSITIMHARAHRICMKNVSADLAPRLLIE